MFLSLAHQAISDVANSIPNGDSTVRLSVSTLVSIAAFQVAALGIFVTVAIFLAKLSRGTTTALTVSIEAVKLKLTKLEGMFENLGTQFDAATSRLEAIGKRLDRFAESHYRMEERVHHVDMKVEKIERAQEDLARKITG